MKKRVNLKNRVSALVMSLFLALGLITPAFSITANAEAAQVLESSATIADCVMSYYAMTGSAVASTDWINTLYGSLGSSFGTIGDFAEQGLMTFVDGVWQPVEQLTQNIANTSAYTELGLDTVFNVSAEEVASGGGYAVATGASTLSGAAACVASNGILPVLGGVTAAYWGGIALGTLIAHKLGLYGHTIENGGSINEYEFFNSLPAGTYGCCDGSEGYYANYPLIAISEPSNNNYKAYTFILYDKSVNDSVRGNVYRASGGVFTSATFYKGVANLFSISRRTIFIPSYNTNNSTDYISNLRNGSATYDKKSPDMIGENGNLTGNYDNENQRYTVPDMKPQIDPQTQSGKPLSLEDWLQFANGVQNNNNSISPVPNNTSLFQDILDAVKSLIPTPTPTPDPSPGGETYPVPGPTPDPSPVPDPEYQPETKPQPQYTEKATENETDITEGDPWTTPDLLDKFPFCIPRDVYRVFTKLDSGARSAPHIQWRFNPNNLIDYTFDIDFSDFDSVAQLLRTLELLGFIVALALATRTMILS